MAKQKRLNKNLVVFLTIMGMVLVVSVFALVVWQQSRRDPEILAQGARQSRAAGDLEEAARRYVRAWEASQARGQSNPQYVIEAANCLFDMGELGAWRGQLEKASAKEPNDVTLVVAYLDGLWRVQDLTGGTLWPEAWRDASQKLRQLEENSILALVSYAQGMWELGGEENLEQANQAAQQAFELSPLDPRVAMTYAAYLQRVAYAELRDAAGARQRPAELEQITRKYSAQVLDVLAAAVAEHPDHVPLVTTYADSLQREVRALAGLGQAEQAAELFTTAGRVLTEALRRNEDHPNPDLHLTLARYQLERFDRNHPDLAAADLPQLRPEIEEIDRSAQRALELDPAVFDAYVLRAELIQRFGTGPQGELLPVAERLDRTLALLDAAKDATLTLRNPRALLRPDDRLLMLLRAFDTAMAAFSLAQNDTPEEERYLTRAEGYLADAQIKHPEHPITYFMQAQAFIARADTVRAIAALEQAYQKSEESRYVRVFGQARFWLSYARLARLPTEQLALLYRERGQFGEAERYSDLAFRQYEAVGIPPPVTTVARRAELLTQVGKPQEALDMLHSYRQTYPQNEILAAARTAVLARLGRTEESRDAMKQVPGADVATRLWRQQVAVEQEDFASAEQILRELLADESLTDAQFQDVLRRLVLLLVRVKRQGEARELVGEWVKNPPRPNLSRLLRALDLELSVENPEQLTPEQREALDTQRKQLIAENPDPLGRASEAYQLYSSRGDWKQALPYLEEMRKLRPDEVRLVEEEFYVRLRLQQFARASELVALLSQCDNGLGLDRARGATYRGDLALAQSDGDAAIREIRQAVQALPKSAALETKLARAYLLTGRMAEGIDALRRAVEINPRSFEAYWFLRQAYRQQAEQSFGAEKAQFEKLAGECEAKASELNPEHPDVLAWRQEAAEAQNPLSAIEEREKKRLGDPTDTANLVRLGQLYLLAWGRVVEGHDQQAKQRVGEQADRFFQEALPAAQGDVQRALARSATGFYAFSGRQDEGVALLRSLAGQQTGEGRLETQVLLASFFEIVGNPDAAEAEYQQAQRLAREAAPDEESRRQLELRVGLAVIGFYERQQRLDKVSEACRWLLDRVGGAGPQAPGVQRLRLTLIESLVNSGHVGDAETETEEYLKLYPDDVSGLSARAQVRLRKGERDLAREDLTQVLQAAPDNVLALYSRGRLELELGHYDKALEDLTKARDLIDRASWLEDEVHRQLTSLYVRTRQYDRASEELRARLDAMERRGARPEQKQQVVRQLAQLLYGSLDQFDQAQRLISEHMEKSPDEPLWPFELGRLFQARAATAEQEARRAKARGDTSKANERAEAARQSYGSAATYFQRAAEQSVGKNMVDAAGATIARQIALTKAGRAAEAVAPIKTFPFDQLPEDRRADARAHMGMATAKAYQALHQDEAAKAQWEQALLDASVTGIGSAGDVATELRLALGLPEAEAVIRKTIERTPADSLPGQRLRLVLAMHLGRSGRPTEALPLLADALAKVKPGMPEYLAALLTRAGAHESTGDRAGAIRTYREALEADPNSTTALNNLAYMLVTSDPPLYAPAEGRKYAERLRGLLPAQEVAASMLDTIGWVYFKNDQLDLAAAALEEALGWGTATPTMSLHLGLVYQKLNRMVEARAVLGKGLEQARQDDNQELARELEEALNKLP
jgi:tetratricopeptide (TPR) repeat protein/predicted Zn-dependent protease/Tfp pilus assembly protein PilF